jgi:uncharacterized protein (DUF58 family)
MPKASPRHDDRPAVSVFDPHVIARIERLELRARRLVEGFMIGIHRSPYHGISTDFAEHRHYVQGDDTRHLDWKIYARSDRFYVKKYEQDTNLEARFLLDASRSMFFAGEGAAMSKFEYAATLVASLAYLLHRQGDAVGLVLFDDRIREFLPPGATLRHYRHLTDTLERASPGGDTALGDALKKIGSQFRRRGLVVVVSDFLDDIAPLAEGLGLHDCEGNEVILFRIEDPVERTLPFRGPSVLLGLEGEQRIRCDPRDLRGQYLAHRARHIGELHDACRQHGFMMEEAPTDAPLDGVLQGFLSTRAEVFRR